MRGGWRLYATTTITGLALWAGVIAGPARAQPAGEVATAPAELVDAYHLTNADGDRVCPIRLLPGAATLGKEKGAPGNPHFAVELDRGACAGAILFAADIAAWSPGPGNAIRLYSAEGRLVAEFTEGAGATWEALREEDGVYFLTNTRLAEPAPSAEPADLMGEWDVSDAAGQTVCRLRLTDAAVAGGAFRLVPEARCGAMLGRPAPDRWRLEGGDLLLEGAGGMRLRFAIGEDAVWSKVPVEAQPLHLMRLP
ncbi:AprI/Inh family metalloprotease inhibitor [Ancylobacter radicis]|uniref:AprI/Inh family metalloprotease inhibitor n=1 Tax=Ancylobacter radicis TaxID=2836179 RepID=A0ABS5RC94_9HYPH|nr:AprI/Inh family metalloprotease inhibitor [Ancylobacter radicis]MBS9479283.1 AprI/Inh family metalloprotease inhibitor [Ancylobacter radicis]